MKYIEGQTKQFREKCKEIDELVKYADDHGIDLTDERYREIHDEIIKAYAGLTEAWATLWNTMAKHQKEK